MCSAPVTSPDLQLLTIFSLFFLLAHLQEKLTDFLPKLLDCSAEMKSFQKPPALSCYSAVELYHRFSSIVANLTLVPSEAR